MGKLTRRKFLTIAAAGLGFAVIESAMSPIMRADELIKGGRSVSRTSGLPRRGVPSSCQMCSAHCGIIAYVEEDAVVKVEGNPRDPNSRGRLCAKGQAGVNLLYNPDRLLYPIRRKGSRGSGEWMRIAWDEALDEVATHLKRLRSDGRAGDLVFLGGLLEGTGSLAGRLMQAWGTTKVFDEGALYTANQSTALKLTLGVDNAVPDLEHSRYILNFGANPAESHLLMLPLVQRLVTAQTHGAKLVTLDPRLSNTAARSAEWLPVKPGSDGVVALAMANVIVQRGLYDTGFMRNWVNYPLEGLAQYLTQYPPEAAERVSGISAADIVRTAVEFASNHPATTLTGGGASQNANGTATERAITLLNALTGNVDAPGGLCLPRRYDLAEPDPSPPAQQAGCSNCANLHHFFDAIRQGSEHPGVLLTHHANPVFTAPDPAFTASVLHDERLVPYHVAFDSYLTETAVLADLVLPAATYLESWDIQSPPALEMVPYVTLTQPAISPLGEAMPFHDVAINIAKRLGPDVEKYFAFGTMDGYIAAKLRGVAGLDKAGGIDYLKRYGVWFDPAAQRGYRSYEAKGFPTASKMLEIDVKQLAQPGRAALPSVPIEPGDGDGFTLITFQFPVHQIGRTGDAMWLSEIVHENPVWIHPERAAMLGIKRGDAVKLQTEAGTIHSKAWLTEAINPYVLAIGVGVGQTASSRIARAKVFKSAEPNSEHVWWAKYGNGTHPYALIPFASDPVGGGPSWMATRVKISKV